MAVSQATERTWSIENIRDLVQALLLPNQSCTGCVCPFLHSLLIPGTLSFLSVASNRNLKLTPAFRLIGANAKKGSLSSFLFFLFTHL